MLLDDWLFSKESSVCSKKHKCLHKQYISMYNICKKVQNDFFGVQFLGVYDYLEPVEEIMKNFRC